MKEKKETRNSVQLNSTGYTPGAGHIKRTTQNQDKEARKDGRKEGRKAD